MKTNNTFEQISNADFIFTTDKTAKNTFYKSSKYSKDFFDYIIYDEAHKIGEETIYKNLIEWFNPKFFLGTTATPERSDNPKYLFEVFKYNVPFNSGSEDYYMNAIGELMDKKNKKVYCPITISEKETFHDNSIYESDKIIYLTKTSMTKEAAEKKSKEFIDKNYEFCIGVRFSHLQYSNTSYFNMGKVKTIGEAESNIVDTKKYNHKIKFQLEEKIPDELLQYKTLLE